MVHVAAHGFGCKERVLRVKEGGAAACLAEPNQPRGVHSSWQQLRPFMVVLEVEVICGIKLEMEGMTT